MTTVRKKKVKEVKAWALRFRNDSTLYPTGHAPTLFDTRKEAVLMANLLGFRDLDEYYAEAVRVSIRPMPRKARK